MASIKKTRRRAEIVVNAYIHDIEVQLHTLIVPLSIFELISEFFCPWIDFKDPPIAVHKVSRPCYYYSKSENKDYLLIAPTKTNPIDGLRHIYRFDYKDNAFTDFTTYPPGFNSKCCGTCVDERNQLFYVFYGQGSDAATFDLQSQKWSILDKNKCKILKMTQSSYIANPSVCFIPYPINEIHVMATLSVKSCHTMFDIETSQFKKASVNGIGSNQYLSSTCLVHLKSRDLLLAIGGYTNCVSDEMWMCNVAKKSKDYVWETMKCKLPFASCAASLCIPVMNGNFIIACYGEKRCIYYMDVGVGVSPLEWIKCDIDITHFPRWRRWFVTYDNYIHFVDFYSDQHRVHKMIHVSMFVPRKLYNKYAD